MVGWWVWFLVVYSQYKNTKWYAIINSDVATNSATSLFFHITVCSISVQMQCLRRIVYNRIKCIGLIWKILRLTVKGHKWVSKLNDVIFIYKVLCIITLFLVVFSQYKNTNCYDIIIGDVAANNATSLFLFVNDVLYKHNLQALCVIWKLNFAIVYCRIFVFDVSFE